MRERVDATRDKPYRQATAARGAREPDRDAVLSSERVERGAHIIIGAKSMPSQHNAQHNNRSSEFSFRQLQNS